MDNDLLKENISLKNQIRFKDSVIKNLKMCLAIKEQKIQVLESKERNDSLKMLPFSDNQIDIMCNKKKRVVWTPEEISEGFTMSYFNRRGYLYLIKNLKYPLPSIRTLNRYAQKLTITPGIILDSFRMLNAFSKNLKDVERLVTIGFDEMKCKSVTEYHKGLDCILGPHSQMQVTLILYMPQ